MTYVQCEGQTDESRTLITDTTKEATMTADAMALEMAFGRRRPSAALMTNPIRGRGESARAHRHHLREVNASGFSDSRCREQRNDDSQTDGKLRRGYGDDKECDDLAVKGTELPSEGDKLRFTALSMISIDNRIVIRFRLRKTPAAPMANRMAETIR